VIIAAAVLFMIIGLVAARFTATPMGGMMTH
jgi:hypothetical protein